MRQKQKKDSGIVNLALLFALTTTPIATNMLLSAPMLAQSETDTPSFELPETVETGTTVRIDGSNTLLAVNQSLKQSFEQQFTGTRVDVANNGTEAALKAVLDGNIDVAAIGRGLTPEEKAQGLEQVRLHREKIAIIVGEENPFKGSLTDRQFARIFRGRITNWSQLGAPSAKIRVLDRPETSDTRQALNNYPVFKAARFATGSTATQVTEDNTTEIAKQLGKDGISYARANQVLKLPGVRVLQLHETLPDDPKYPFSQPLVYVYKKSPNPAIASFLGFALAPPGQKAIETARVNEAEAIAKGEPQALLTTGNPSSTPEANTSPFGETTPIINSTTETTPATNIFPNAGGTTTNVTQPAIVAPPETPKLDRSLLWWLLLPVGAIAGLVLWFIKRPSTAKVLDSEPTETETASIAAAPVTEPLVQIQDHTTPIPVANNSPTVLQTANGTAITNQSSENNHNSGSYQIAIPPELEQSPWDMEAPASVVNTAYPQMMEAGKSPTYEEQTAEIPQVPSVEENHQELTEELPQPPENLSEITEDTNTQATSEDTLATADSLPDLPDFYAIFADEKDDNHTITEASIEESFVDEQSNNIEESFVDEQSNNIEESFVDEQSNDSTEVIISDELPETEITPELTTASLSKFSDIPEDALNLVADAAEFNENETLEDTEYLTPSSLGALAGGTVLAAAGMEVWASNNEIEEGNTSPVSTNDTSEENLPAILATTAELEDGEEESSIILKPRNPEWAYVSWYISLSDQQKLQEKGISELVLQLYDVTDLDLSYQTPQQVQQDECQPGTSDRFISIPASDRDYMIEIGHITVDEQWSTIARSPIVRAFDDLQTDSLSPSLPELDEKSTVTFTSRTPKWAYVSWDISPVHQQLLKDQGISQLALRLYDATNIDLSYQNPQLVQQYEFDGITCDRYVLIPNSDRDYMTEVGYLTSVGDWVTIARSAIVRVFNSPQEDFWFVADTELIIHGATDPSATVTIAGKPVTLKSDGTFHLRVPFSQDLLDYLITVTSGQQKKTVHKKFAQETSES